MVEWCLPHDINLDGVEFKSMASGSHRITNDFMCVVEKPGVINSSSVWSPWLENPKILSSV